MSELKIGDRVKVAAFEGVVSHVSFYDPQNIEVAIDGGGEASLPARRARRAEYVKPPLKVGDTVRGVDAYRALPIGAVVTDRDEARVRVADGFISSTTGKTLPVHYLDNPRTIVYLPAA